MASRLLPHASPVLSAEIVMSMLDDVNALHEFSTRIWTRRGERRADLRQVMRALAAGLIGRPDDRSLQRVFEQELSRVLLARSIRLREVPTRFQARLATPTRTPESVVLDVPTPDPGRQVVLEATFEPGRPIDQWNADLLSAAAHLGALVMEADGRRSMLSTALPRFDGAAP